MGKINWFPGHMAKAFHALNRIIKGVDMVLEVRDARVSADANWGFEQQQEQQQQPKATFGTDLTFPCRLSHRYRFLP
jgi:hypothetical protein